MEKVHVTLPRRVATACAAAGVPRLVHMSALNADPQGPSEYLRSRGRGEAAVMEVAARHPALSVAVFRPSLIFGERDHLLNLFAGLARAFPVIPLGSAEARFQPVWVEDVARAIVTSLTEGGGGVHDLVGPRVLTLRELVAFAAAQVGKKPWIIGLGPGLAMLQAAVFERLPGRLITRDNVRSMRLDSTRDTPFPARFGRARAMEAVAPGWFARDRAGYDRFRQSHSSR